MLSKQKLQSMKYIKNEFNILKNDPILTLGFTRLYAKYGKEIFLWN